MKSLALALAIGCVLVTTGTAAQEAAPLIPALPVDREDAGLYARELGRPTRAAAAVWLQRRGFAGSTVRPNELPLPAGGQAIQLERYDWLIPGEIDVEIRVTDGNLPWLEMGTDASVVALDVNRVDLSWGEVRWVARDADAYGRAVSADDHAVRGAGTAAIRRAPDRLEVTVVRGRFEITRGSQLVALIGAGQSRSIPLTRRVGGEQAYRDSRNTLSGALEDAVEELLAAGREAPAAPSGEALATIWESVSAFLPHFGAAQAASASFVARPHHDRRDIGEALRLLAVYRFGPPPVEGM